MQLLTAELRSQLSRFYAQEKNREPEHNLQVLLPLVQLDVVRHRLPATGR